MGRRRLYHTAEQKKEANRAKSKCSYERRKETVNKKRRKEYAKAHKRLAMSQKAPKNTSASVANPLTPSRAIAIWLERADRIRARLHKFTRNNVVKFLDGVVEDFLKHRNKDVVYEQVVAIGKFQSSIYRYENKVLMLAGLGAEYQRVQEITREVCKVIRWLEEVLCMAMVDANEVHEMYKAGRLEFQIRVR